MKTYKELIESINDDDYYLLHKETKKIVKNLGKHSIGFEYNRTPEKAPVFSTYVKDGTHTVLTGMKARHQGYTK